MGVEGIEATMECATDSPPPVADVSAVQAESGKAAATDATVASNVAVEAAVVTVEEAAAEVVVEPAVEETPSVEAAIAEAVEVAVEADETEAAATALDAAIVEAVAEAVVEDSAATPDAEVEVVADGVAELSVEEKSDAASSADLTIPAANESTSTLESTCNNGSTATIHKHGFTLPDLYAVALEYYRQNKQNLVTVGYHDKIQLVALWKQITSGVFSDAKCPQVGYFDYIGNDRRKAWQQLGDMETDVAKEKFCDLLEQNCVEYVAFVKERRAALDAEIERKRLEEEQRKRLEEEERLRKEEEERLRLEEEERVRKEQEEEERRKAEEERLRLEEEQAKAEEEKTKAAAEAAKTEAETGEASVEESLAIGENTPEEGAPTAESSQETTEAADSSTDAPTIAPASLWTRPKLQEFISHVKGDVSSVLVVGRGETVTVRVPTHDNGSCLFWEFGTEYYDVGFGVYFEWSTSKSTAISVNVNESDNEDEDESPDVSDEGAASNDSSVGDTTGENIVVVDKPRMDEVVAVLRRNSHEEVIVGSHTYPGQGTYLLKFDNSYSLLRSKTLYYRVYYTK